MLLTKEIRNTTLERHESQRPPRSSLGQSETLALRAAFLQGAQAVEAWHEFIARYDFDDLFPASTELLPIVYHNLSKQGCTGQGFGKVQGIQRKIWYSNQLLLKDLAVYLKALFDANIEVMLVKNCALSLQYYEHPGLRNIRDFDLVVRRKNFDRALRVLEGFGLRQLQLDSRNRYLNLQGTVLDLATPGQEEKFWNSASEIQVLGSQATALARIDQLFHTFLNRRSYGASASIWVADVLTVAGTIRDAESVVDRVHFHRLAGPIKHSAMQLLQAFPEGAEATVIQKLVSLDVSIWEKFERHLWAALVKEFKAYSSIAR